MLLLNKMKSFIGKNVLSNKSEFMSLKFHDKINNTILFYVIRFISQGVNVIKKS